MELTWLGTAAFRIVVDKTVLLLDPFLSRPRDARPVAPIDWEDIAAADYILLSHGHFDHAYDAARLAARTGARILAPALVCNDLRNRGVPDQQLRPLRGVETIGLTDLRVRVIPSRHISVDRRAAWESLRRGGWRLLRHINLVLGYPARETIAYLLAERDDTLCFFGSAAYDPARILDLRPGLALVPVQGRSDITHVAADLVAELAPRWVIPHHHDDFFPPLSREVDLTPFVAEVQRRLPETQVHIPVVGQKLRYERGKLSVVGS